jgi:hypothetical protein
MGLTGTFFFSRKHTKHTTPGYFFATLAYQPASNFCQRPEGCEQSYPRESCCSRSGYVSSRPDEGIVLPTSLAPSVPARWVPCLPLVFVVDTINECEPKVVADLICLLVEALHDPELPATHILFMSRLEEHILKAIQTEEMRPLVCELPVSTYGDSVAATISQISKMIFIISCGIPSESCEIAIPISHRRRWTSQKGWQAERGSPWRLQ